MSKCCNSCKCKKCLPTFCKPIKECPWISYFDRPLCKRWTISDGEVILHDVCVNLCGNKQIMVDATIAAEISPSADGVYNVYRLYVNGTRVSQVGFEAEDEEFAPNLETSSIAWGGNYACLPHCETVRIKLTAQTISESGSTELGSNVNNKIGKFKGAKNASLRVLAL